MTTIAIVTGSDHRARGFVKPRGTIILSGITSEEGSTVSYTAQFDSSEQAAAFAALLPKSALLKLSSDSVHAYVDLRAKVSTGDVNEAGLERLRQLLTHAFSGDFPVEILQQDFEGAAHSWGLEDFQAKL